MTELLFWLVVVVCAASFAGCFGLMAAIIIGSRGERHDEFRGDQWP